jgi:hypothetical protein
MTSPAFSSACQVLRAGARARANASACQQTPPAAACDVLTLADRRAALFQETYSPAALLGDAAVRRGTLADLEADVVAAEKAVRDGLGVDQALAAGVSWPALSECLWNPDGSAGGASGRKYFGRADLGRLGYAPRPALAAGQGLQGRLPAPVVDLVPVWLDRAFYPEVAALLVFALLVLLFGALLLKAYRSQKPPSPAAAEERRRREKEERRARLEASDPFRGSAFESFPAPPGQKYQKLVAAYEAQGYDMCAYREKLGMPPGEKCPAGEKK